MARNGSLRLRPLWAVGTLLPRPGARQLSPPRLMYRGFQSFSFTSLKRARLVLPELLQEFPLLSYLVEGGLPDEGADAWPVAELVHDLLYCVCYARGEGDGPVFCLGFHVDSPDQGSVISVSAISNYA